MVKQSRGLILREYQHQSKILEEVRDRERRLVEYAEKTMQGWIMLLTLVRNEPEFQEGGRTWDVVCKVLMRMKARIVELEAKQS